MNKNCLEVDKYKITFTDMTDGEIYQNNCQKYLPIYSFLTRRMGSFRQGIIEGFHVQAI